MGRWQVGEEAELCVPSWESWTLPQSWKEGTQDRALLSHGEAKRIHREEEKQCLPRVPVE